MNPLRSAVAAVVAAAVSPMASAPAAAADAQPEATSSTAVAAGPSGTDVFYRIAGGTVAHRTFRAGVWSAADSLGGSTELPPSAARVGNRLVVVITGTDGLLHYRSRLPALPWSRWVTLAGRVSSAPSAVGLPDGSVDVFVRGVDDGLLLRRALPRLQWKWWERLGGTLTTAPAATRTSDGALWVAAAGTDHVLRVRRYAALRWGPWSRTPVSTYAAPALAALGGDLVVAVTSTTDTVTTARLHGVSWSVQQLGPTVVGAPALSPRTDGRLDLFARSTDLGVWTAVYDGSTRSTFVRGWLPAAPQPPARFLGLTAGRLPTTARVVALTFDTEALGDAVPSIRRTLLGRGVPATFFVTGDFARRRPAIVTLLAGSGFAIGDHSDTHPVFPRLTDAQVRAQVTAARSAVVRDGAETRPLFRFPYGEATAHDIALVNVLGYVSVGWNVDAQGWRGVTGGNSVARVVATTLAQVRPGSIVLMHAQSAVDGTALDAAALPTVIDRLRAAGYGFVSLRAFGG